MKVSEMVNAIIRSTVALFAATVGFGLKHLLELDPDTASPDLVTNSWLCFLIVGLHAARFLLGSSAHLTGIYGSQSSYNLWLTIDIFALLTYGALAIRVAYSKSLVEFFGWGVAFFLMPFIWSLISRLFNKEHDKNWSWFMGINAILAACFAVQFLCLWRGKPCCHGPVMLDLHPGVVLFFCISLFAAIWDVDRVLQTVHGDSRPGIWLRMAKAIGEKWTFTRGNIFFGFLGIALGLLSLVLLRLSTYMCS